MSKILRLLSVFCLLIVIVGCGTYPQYRTNHIYNFEQVPIKNVPSKVTKQEVTIEDKGTAKNVIQPMQVQDCSGNLLVVKEVEKQKWTRQGVINYIEKEPVFATVDPLENIYVRRVNVHNTTEHLLYLSQIDSVLVDPAGNEHEIASKDHLKHFVYSNRPCPSTTNLIEAFENIKILGSGSTRIRPKREEEFLVVFPGLKPEIPGEWRLEFHNFPTETNEAGQIIRSTSFEFLFDVKKYKTTVKKRKDSWSSSWMEVERYEEEVTY